MLTLKDTKLYLKIKKIKIIIFSFCILMDCLWFCLEYIKSILEITHHIQPDVLISSVILIPKEN